MFFVDLVVATSPHCKHALRAIVGDCVGGTLESWVSVYQIFINALT